MTFNEVYNHFNALYAEVAHVYNPPRFTVSYKTYRKEVVVSVYFQGIVARHRAYTLDTAAEGAYLRFNRIKLNRQLDKLKGKL